MKEIKLNGRSFLFHNGITDCYTFSTELSTTKIRGSAIDADARTISHHSLVVQGDDVIRRWGKNDMTPTGGLGDGWEREEVLKDCAESLMNQIN